MAVLRNGKPIDEQDYEHEDRYRKEAMSEYRQRKGWGTMPAQSGVHNAADTPRNWKHNRKMRPM